MEIPIKTKEDALVVCAKIQAFITKRKSYEPDDNLLENWKNMIDNEWENYENNDKIAVYNSKTNLIDYRKK